MPVQLDDGLAGQGGPVEVGDPMHGDVGDTIDPGKQMAQPGVAGPRRAQDGEADGVHARFQIYSSQVDNPRN